MANFLENLFSLKNKTAVVIGGTGELCGEMAEGLAKAGAQVVLVGRSEEKARARLQNIAADGGKGDFMACDFGDPAQTGAALSQLLEAVVEKYQGVDILINGAGVNSPTPFFDIEEAEMDRILHVNFRTVVLACQVFGRHMVNRGQGGSIINVGSMSGVIPLSRVFTYSATKAAVHNLSKNLAREWAPQRVRVNTIVPGFFPAEQNRKVLNEERIAQIMGHTPMKRFGEAHELVGATILLASGAGSFMTGTEVLVDGGYAAMTI
jgi:NAD(P)-dependent dehydrogenase (short-subunit alcohol dehydrogenase family)